MLAFRPEVRGLRHVPSKGPVIIASNHLSFSDSIFMPLVVPRKVTFLAKSEYFTSPGPKGLLKKLTFIALGQVPVKKSEHIERIAELLEVDEELLESLEKVNKTVLKLIEHKLANPDPKLHQTAQESDLFALN